MVLMKSLFVTDKDEERSWCHLTSLLPRGQQPRGVVGLRLDNGSTRPGIIWQYPISNTQYPVALVPPCIGICYQILDIRYSVSAGDSGGDFGSLGLSPSTSWRLSGSLALPTRLRQCLLVSSVVMPPLARHKPLLASRCSGPAFHLCAEWQRNAARSL